jgi:hypothetical protein
MSVLMPVSRCSNSRTVERILVKVRIGEFQYVTVLDKIGHIIGNSACVYAHI